MGKQVGQEGDAGGRRRRTQSMRLLRGRFRIGRDQVQEVVERLPGELREHLAGAAGLSRSYAEARLCGLSGEELAVLRELGVCTPRPGDCDRLTRLGVAVVRALEGEVEIVIPSTEELRAALERLREGLG